jgi:thioredoxin-like negative regulator of GroEL
MTKQGQTRRRGRLVLLAAIALAAPAGATPRRDRTVAGDVIKAARYLQTARLDDARSVLADLEKRSPDTPEVKWLAGELAFQTGDYAGAQKLLDALPDTAVDGLAGQTKKLGRSTAAVTDTFVDERSPKGHFIIRHPPGPDATIAVLAGEVLDAAWDAIGDDLGYKPADPIRVELLGAPADLAKLSPLTEAEIETTGTIALSKYNKLMVVSPRATIFGYPWMDTLAHEYLHLVVTQLSHDEVPIWLQEGLARFEQARWRAEPGVAPMAAAERQLLATAVKKGRLIGLDEMHPSIAKLPSQEAAALAYAEVLTLVQWLHGKIGYAGLRDVIAREKDGKSARRAIADVVGTSFTKVEKAWKASLRGMDAGTGAGGGKPGKTRKIHFAHGGKSDDNLGLDQVGNAKAKKHARIAGMLRARGMLDGAVVEYDKAIAASGNDPFLTGKLARTLLDLGKFDRAAELAAPLVAADESDAVAAVTLGLARSAQTRWAEAAAGFELALRVSPFDPAVRCGLADAYAQTGNAGATREREACDLLRSQAH